MEHIERDVLNPLQPKAKGINRKELKREFGGKLIFHGGIDIQYILPRGTIEEVESEAKDVIETYAPGGEYIFSPAHNRLMYLLKTFLPRIEPLCSTVGFTINSLSQPVIRNNFYEIL